MRKIFFAALTFSAVVSLQACQSADKKSSTTKDSVGGDTTMVNGVHTTGAESTESSLDEQGATFLKKASVGGIMEIQASKIALENSKNPEIKNFAQMMVTDHTKLHKELKDFAFNKKIITPDALPADDQIHIDAMKKLTGSNFDKHYIEMMVNDHDKTTKLYQDGINNRDVELKNWATEAYKIIEKHAAQAKELSQKIK